MGIRGRHYTISQFICLKCGREGIPISRKQSNQREPGHLKKLYCLYCQEETNHLEKRDFDEISADELNDYLLELQENEESIES